MTEKEAIARLKEHYRIHDDGRPTPKLDEASGMAIKALEAQIKLKEYIESLNQPEYQNIVWKKDEVVLLLKELMAE